MLKNSELVCCFCVSELSGKDINHQNKNPRNWVLTLYIFIFVEDHILHRCNRQKEFLWLIIAISYVMVKKTRYLRVCLSQYCTTPLIKVEREWMVNSWMMEYKLNARNVFSLRIGNAAFINPPSSLYGMYVCVIEEKELSFLFLVNYFVAFC